MANDKGSEEINHCSGESDDDDNSVNFEGNFNMANQKLNSYCLKVDFQSVEFRNQFSLSRKLPIRSLRILLIFVIFTIP